MAAIPLAVAEAAVARRPSTRSPRRHQAEEGAGLSPSSALSLIHLSKEPKIMTTESPIDAHWIPPLIPELKILERDGRWLCLSPQVPSWIITTRPRALLLRMVDGERTLQEYHEILEGQGIRAPLSALASFFQSAADAKLFGPARDAGAKSSWQDRKLTALYLHLTNRCNLQCSYCYRESSPRLPIAHDS